MHGAIEEASNEEQLPKKIGRNSTKDKREEIAAKEKGIMLQKMIECTYRLDNKYIMIKTSAPSKAIDNRGGSLIPSSVK